MIKGIRIGFRFVGRLADQHVIDASDGVTFETAARQLLAVQAHFFVTGKVPNGGAVNHTSDYRVYQAGRSNGSVIFDYVVDFLQVAHDEMRKEIAAAFVGYLAATLKNTLSRKVPPPQPLWNDEKTAPLASSEGNREPLYDPEYERQLRWQHLAERNTGILVDVMRPVDRSAAYLEIIAEGRVLTTLRVDDLRKLLNLHQHDQERQRVREMQIVEALNALRRH